MNDLSDENVAALNLQVEMQIQAQHDDIQQNATTSGDSFAENVKNNAYLSEDVVLDEIIDHMKTNERD